MTRPDRKPKRGILRPNQIHAPKEPVPGERALQPRPHQSISKAPIEANTQSSAKASRITPTNSSSYVDAAAARSANPGEEPEYPENEPTTSDSRYDSPATFLMARNAKYHIPHIVIYPIKY